MSGFLFVSLHKTRRMVSVNKKKSKLSFDKSDDNINENGFEFKPESIVTVFSETGQLPKEFNPYRNYIPEKSVFLGDETPPGLQFRDDGSKKWEVINNEDVDLTPIYFSLPSPPSNPKHIDGYNLPKDEQYFHKLEVPSNFRKLEKKALDDLYEIEKRNRQDTVQGYKFYLKFWELFKNEADLGNLNEEIKWLRNVWWHRIYGYWFYNDGEPTYLPPDYFDFLNFYYISEAECYPEYRDDVRRKFCFARYLESCTETFAHIDPVSGKAMKGEDGRYEMIDMGRRLFFGDCEPKTRRTGATHEAVHKILKGAITNLSYFSTIISFEGNNAEIHYKKKLLPAFDNYPMCLKPMWEGNRRPTVLRLDTPPNIYHMGGLKSAIAISDSGGLFKNEGDRLNGLLNDEQGKNSALSINIFERWNVNKFTMSTGMGINILKGVYVKNPSTVEQMESTAAPYYKMCMMSDFYRRIPIKGQTASGFARIFLPAYLRMEGFIDRFGKSVIDAPTERQIKLSPHSIFAVARKGSKQMFQAERDTLLAENTPQSLEAYRSIRRKSPFNWAECWIGSSGNVGFNLEIVDTRLGELNRLKSFGKTPYKIGYFYREGGGADELDGRVMWKTDINIPKFKMSMDLPPNLTNQREMIEVWDGLSQKVVPSWRPLNGQRFTCGVDPFRNLRANEAKESAKIGASMSNSRQSDGGIAILWEHDPEKDRGIDKMQWESYRCVLSYRYRPATQIEYFEDVLMAAEYFGAAIYPEQNVERFIEYVYARSRGGYFLFDIDMATGRQKPLPGRWTSAEVLQEMVREIKDYIENRCHIECHDDLLTEIKNLRGIEDFTRSDLLTAFAYSLLGSKSRYREFMGTSIGDSINLDDIFPMRTY